MSIFLYPASKIEIAAKLPEPSAVYETELDDPCG